MCAGLKHNIGCSTAELVYGIANFETFKWVFLYNNLTCYQIIKRTSCQFYSLSSTHVSDMLSKCTHIFVRHDTMRKPLQQPHNGLFRDWSTFYSGRHLAISVDRLKPAIQVEPDTRLQYIYFTTTVTPQPSNRVIRSCHQVQWPQKVRVHLINNTVV